MKTILKTLLTATVIALNTNSVQAENTNLKWTKTAFWKAPMLSQLAMKVKPREFQLASACEQYKEFISSTEGQIEWPGLARKVERFRTSPLPGSPINVFTFEANFEITNLLANTALIEESVDLSSKYSVEENNEVLPMFTHLKATTGTSVHEIGPFKIEYVLEQQSLTKASRNLGLLDSKISVDYDSSGNPVVKIEGRDVACDLIYGNIKITAKSPSYVKLPSEEVSELESFYHTKLGPQINRILSIPNETSILKAARLGFQMSKLLEEELNQKDIELTGKHIKSLIEVLFIPKTLDASENLVEINKKKTVNLVSSTEGESVTLNLSL